MIRLSQQNISAIEPVFAFVGEKNFVPIQDYVHIYDMGDGYLRFSGLTSAGGVGVTIKAELIVNIPPSGVCVYAAGLKQMLKSIPGSATLEFSKTGTLRADRVNLTFPIQPGAEFPTSTIRGFIGAYNKGDGLDDIDIKCLLDVLKTHEWMLEKDSSTGRLNEAAILGQEGIFFFNHALLVLERSFVPGKAMAIPSGFASRFDGMVSDGERWTLATNAGGLYAWTANGKEGKYIYRPLSAIANAEESVNTLSLNAAKLGRQAETGSFDYSEDFVDAVSRCSLLRAPYMTITRKGDTMDIRGENTLNATSFDLKIDAAGCNIAPDNSFMVEFLYKAIKAMKGKPFKTRFFTAIANDWPDVICLSSDQTDVWIMPVKIN